MHTEKMSEPELNKLLQQFITFAWCRARERPIVRQKLRGMNFSVGGDTMSFQQHVSRNVKLVYSGVVHEHARQTQHGLDFFRERRCSGFIHEDPVNDGRVCWKR